MNAKNIAVAVVITLAIVAVANRSAAGRKALAS
jgi:hypothetical protein